MAYTTYIKSLSNFAVLIMGGQMMNKLRIRNIGKSKL